MTYLHLGTSAMLVEKFLWDWLGGLVAVLTALWIASPVWHLELLQHTPCTGHGAPGIFA